MRGLILVRGARQLLTLHGPAEPRRGSALRDLGLIHDGSVLIRDGVIEEVGPTRRVENLSLARAAEEIDATGRIVMPGFVDSHAHLVFGPPWLKDFEMRVAGSNARDAATGLEASNQTVQNLSIGALGARSQRVVEAMVRHGTTTFESKTGYGTDASGELKILRVLARLNRRPLDVVPTLLLPAAGRAEIRRAAEPAALSARADRLLNELLCAVQQRKLASFVDVPCGESGFELPAAERLIHAAKDLGFLVKIQADPLDPLSAVPLAVRQGAVSIAHLESISPEDIGLLASSGTIATLLPGSLFNLRDNPRPPVRALIDAGAAVALASNFNPHTSPTCNMQVILALGCAALGMTPGEAISAATINGAYALRRGDHIGSLEHGKSADLLVMNVSDYREVPYHFGMNAVHLTMKRGSVIYREGPVEVP